MHASLGSVQRDLFLSLLVEKRVTAFAHRDLVTPSVFWKFVSRPLTSSARASGVMWRHIYRQTIDKRCKGTVRNNDKVIVELGLLGLDCCHHPNMFIEAGVVRKRSGETLFGKAKPGSPARLLTMGD
jgi:hypothetical protein